MKLLMRVLYFSVGAISLILGVIGIVLPLLPTTPFLILSAFCFAKSSQRVHDWLIEHPYFGNTIVEWRKHGVINKKAKIIAMVTIFLTFMISVFLQVAPMILGIQFVVLSLVSLFILTRPSEPRMSK